MPARRPRRTRSPARRASRSRPRPRAPRRWAAHDQAQKFYEEALAVTTDEHERAELLIQAAEEARIQGNYEPAEKLLREAIELASEIDATVPPR